MLLLLLLLAMPRPLLVCQLVCCQQQQHPCKLRVAALDPLASGFQANCLQEAAASYVRVGSMVSAELNVHHHLLTHGCQQNPERIRCKVRTATHREISHTTAPTIGIDRPMLYRS
jgi:hypothetical protein